MPQDSLDKLAERYIEMLKVRNLAERTINARKWLLGKFLEYLQQEGITELTAISKVVIQDYQVSLYHTINRYGRPNSAIHQNNIFAAVKGFMRFLKDNDYIVTDPARDIPYAKLPKTLPRGILSRTEARRIINAPDTHSVIGYRDRAILEVFYTTGIRRNELCDLTLNDVDYHDGFLQILCGKGRKDRIVPLGRIACRYLENYIKSVRQELIRDPYNSHLFLSSRGNKLSKTGVWELVKKYAKAAKIKKNVHPHTFRHTCATDMLKNKADIRTVQELLGHESLESTQVYTKITIDDLKAVHHRCHPREKDDE